MRSKGTLIFADCSRLNERFGTKGPGLRRGDVVNSDARNEKRTAFFFFGSQRQIYASLAQIRSGLAELYEAALRVNFERYPAHLVLAAHSLRELVHGLAEALDIPICFFY